MSSKRPNDNGLELAPKTKRSRYVSNACNECKRRKVKCTGDEPCERCLNSMTICSYPRTLARGDVDGLSTSASRQHEDNGSTSLANMDMQIRTIMEKVDSLHQKMNSLSGAGTSLHEATHSETPGLVSLVEQQQNPSKETTDETSLNSVLPRGGSPRRLTSPSGAETLSPEYHGPTSSEFTFTVANESFGDLGISGTTVGNESPKQAMNPSFSLPVMPGGHTADKTLLGRLLTRDPLWTIQRSDAFRWMNIYHDSLGAMYPVVESQHLEAKTHTLFDALEAIKAGRYRDHFSRALELLYSGAINEAKLLIAMGSIMELGVGNSEMAVQLVQSVLDSSDDSLMNAEGIHGVQLLVLTALFYLHLDEELKASRYVCLASRRCLEMGLHRRETLLKHFPAEAPRKEALRFFWSVFMLDRRSSLGLGVPFVIQDSLVDPKLVAMPFDHLYLRTMIPFTKLSGKAWHMSNVFSSKDPDVVRDEVDYLDYQVLQWQRQIPESLRYSPGSSGPSSDEHADPSRVAHPADSTQERFPQRSKFFLSVALCVRANQLRNVIYRPLLQSPSRIQSHGAQAATALLAAQDSLRVLVELETSTDLLVRHTVFFKHFIVSALGNLLLLAVHAAAEYWARIRDTFYAGLALLRRLSTRCGPVMRVWDRLKGLEDLHNKIAARRRDAGTSAAAVVWDGDSGGLRTSEKSNARNDEWRGGPLDTDQTLGSEQHDDGGGGEYMLFDSQIRDEFAGLFDSSLDVADLFDFPVE
ncbi:hypothetical protein FOPE_04216 [Fonsecaea pedrosoi]|nr:hypothetical protein FOPE_04216 [Fonsecaea pedrosoi]